MSIDASTKLTNVKTSDPRGSHQGDTSARKEEKKKRNEEENSQDGSNDVCTKKSK